MNVKCPQCETGYELPLSLLPKPGINGAPNRLRCVRCKCVFVMAAELAQPGESSGNKDVYFELVSPNAMRNAGFLFEDLEDTSSQRIKYQIQAVAADGSTGPVVTDPATWSTESTLDLSDYEIRSFERAAKWKARAASFFILLIIGSVLYVAAMNNWSISVNNLENDIKRAFFLQSDSEIEAELLLQMTITLGKGYTVHLKKGKLAGIINGEIQNNSSVHVENVLLEGRLLDATKKVVATVVIPCGVVIPDAQIRGKNSETVYTLYQEEGVYENCDISSGYSAPFKVIFSELPAYFNSTYRFEVHPKSLSPKKDN